jgi:hypothetical protein
MLIAVCSDKGSPGATTTALTLASVWPERAVVVEADPYGGDLAIRLRTPGGATLPEAPTVLSLAAAARTSQSRDLAVRYAQPFTAGVAVIPGQVSAEQSAGVLDWEALGSALVSSQLPAVVDVGRLHAGSPVAPVAAMADVVVVVGRPDAGSVIRLRERLSRLATGLPSHRGAPARLFAVLVSPSRHGEADVSDLRRILAESSASPFLVDWGFVAFDPRAVARLEAGEDPMGRLARTALLRTARDVVSQLGAVVGSPGGLRSGVEVAGESRP